MVPVLPHGAEGAADFLIATLDVVAYRELGVPADLRSLVEAAWTSDGGGRVLPDGCMDLMMLDDVVTVAGPDTAAYASQTPARGLRFHPGVLPRLLGVPAAELRDARVRLDALRRVDGETLTSIARRLAAESPSAETAPWELPALGVVTRQLASGAAVTEIADRLGWSPRTLQRQCGAVFGYGPTTARRVLRFRRAVSLLRRGQAVGDVAAECGYSDQPHMHREVRALAGITLSQLGIGGK